MRNDFGSSKLTYNTAGGQHGNQGGRETGFEEDGAGSSSLVTETQPEDGTYKPKLHVRLYT